MIANERESILFVAPWVPSKQRPRSYGLIEALLQEYDVTAVLQTWSASDRAEAAELATVSPRLNVVSVKESKFRAMVRAVLALGTRRSLQQAFTNSRAFRRVLRETTASVAPAMTYLNVIRSAHFSNEVSGTLVIDLDEFRSDYYRQVAKNSRNPVWRYIGALEARRMARAEAKVVEEFDLILVSSPAELRTGAKTALVWSPHTLDEALALTPDADEAQPSVRLLFVGRLSYRANYEAVDWLAKELMPKLRLVRDDATLSIVGRDPRPATRRLASSAVDVVGGVPDVAPYYAQSDVSLVPIRMATGVQMKLIESAVMRTPIVTSPVSAERAGLLHEHHCLIADDATEWVSAISRILADAELRRRLTENAHEWASQFSREKVSESVLRLLREL